MPRGLRKAFSVFHKLYSGLGEGISPRAPLALCLAPTYPDGRTCLLCCFSSTASVSCHSVVFLNWRDRYFRGVEWKISSFLLSGKGTSCFALLCWAWHSFFAHSVFQLPCFSPCPNLYAFKNSCTRYDCRVVTMLQEIKRGFMCFLFPRLSKSQVAPYAEGKPSWWQLKYSAPNSRAAGAGGCFEC